MWSRWIDRRHNIMWCGNEEDYNENNTITLFLLLIKKMLAKGGDTTVTDARGHRERMSSTSGDW